jgi:ubiquinone/menaquinone biosynthesis C-methylase UbiE
MPVKQVKDGVAKNNEWYVDHQRSVQLGTEGWRWGLNLRWCLFERAIDRWLGLEVPAPKRLRILDAGCGDGLSVSVLENIFTKRGYHVDIVGLDYNRFRLERVLSNQQISVVEADLRNIPFASGSFDFVLCSHVLEHIKDDFLAMRELARLVRCGGLVLVAVPNEGCLLAMLRNKLIQRSIAKSTDHVQFYTAKKLMTKLISSGLKPVYPVENEGIFLPHQGVYTRLRETKIGRVLLSTLAFMLPSQAAGLVVALERDGKSQRLTA